MRISVLYIAICFGFYFVSCKTNTGKKIVLSGDFPITNSIELISIQNIVELCPENIMFLDGYLIVNNNCHEYLIQVIRVKDFQSKYFIQKGRGPGEMFRANFSGHISGDSLLIRNTPESSLWINPHKLFSEKQFKNDEKFIKIPDPAPIYQNENVFNFQGNWVFNDYSSDEGHLGFFVFLNSKGEIVKKTDYIPELSYKLDERIIGYAYITTTRINESQTRFVSALKYFPYFIITDIDGEYEVVVQTEKSYLEPVFKEGEINPSFESEFFYGSVILTDKYIFLYRLNMTLGELVNYFSGQVDRQATKTGFEVYTWQGKPVCYLEINKLLVNPAIDFKEGIIYALEFDPNSGYDIVKGHLPENILQYFNE